MTLRKGARMGLWPAGKGGKRLDEIRKRKHQKNAPGPPDPKTTGRGKGFKAGRSKKRAVR